VSYLFSLYTSSYNNFLFLTEMVRLFKIRHTTSHLFKIDNFSLLKKHGIEKVESSVFDLAGHKWCEAFWSSYWHTKENKETV